MVMEQSTDELVIGELFPCIMVNDEIIGKVICINEEISIPNIYVSMSLYHS